MEQHDLIPNGSQEEEDHNDEESLESSEDEGVNEDLVKEFQEVQRRKAEVKQSLHDLKLHFADQSRMKTRTLVQWLTNSRQTVAAGGGDHIVAEGCSGAGQGTSGQASPAETRFHRIMMWAMAQPQWVPIHEQMRLRSGH